MLLASAAASATLSSQSAAAVATVVHEERKMTDKFSHDEEMALIEFVSFHKCLYDASHKNYKDVILRDNVWKEITSQMKGKSDEDCKKRWQSIRDTYKRLLRQGKMRTGLETQSKQKWPLANYLTFLKNISEERSTTSNIQEIPPEDVESNNEENEIEDDPSFLAADDSNSQLSTPISVGSTSSSESLVGKRKFNEEISHLLQENKKSRKEMIDALLESNVKKEKDDEIDIFYKSIAMTVKRLPPHLIAKAKMRHLQVVTDLEMQFLSQQSIMPQNQHTHNLSQNLYSDYQPNEEPYLNIPSISGTETQQ